jgi:hypothetical protein
MEVLAEYLVHIAVLVLCCWSPLTLVWVLSVLHLMIWVLVRCPMEGFLCRIRGCRGAQFQGMAFLFWRCG